MNKSTSWGNVADWYDNLIKKNSYQKKLILPNPIRLAEIKRGEIIVDLAPLFKLNEAYKNSNSQVVSRPVVRWDNLHDHFIRIYRTMQQFNVQTAYYATC